MVDGISVKVYDETDKKKWDSFVLCNSFNGTFLQTRNFLNYHPSNRFIDNSLLFIKDNEELIAVIPANKVESDSKVFYSHKGSTFGGIIIGKNYLKISYLDMIFENLDKYFIDNNYDKVIFKQTGNIYQNEKNEILDYYFFINGYNESSEIGYYIDFIDYNDDILSNFSSSAHRNYRHSLDSGFKFQKLTTEKEIRLFYEVLLDSYTKFNKMPVHNIDELLDLKFNRLFDNIDFYGVFKDEELVAAGMIFKFAKNVFHTQYLAVKRSAIKSFANEFLYKNLIETAKSENFKYISFGTSTLDGGLVLNRSLAKYKERFGTSIYVNRTYKKTYCDRQGV